MTGLKCNGPREGAIRREHRIEHSLTSFSFHYPANAAGCTQYVFGYR